MLGLDVCDDSHWLNVMKVAEAMPDDTREAEIEPTGREKRATGPWPVVTLIAAPNAAKLFLSKHLPRRPIP
jgi:hypothetical protein